MWFTDRCFPNGEINWASPISDWYDIDDREYLEKITLSFLSENLLVNLLDFKKSVLQTIRRAGRDCVKSGIIVCNIVDNYILIKINYISIKDYDFFIALDFLDEIGLKIDIDQEEPFAKIKVYL